MSPLLRLLLYLAVLGFASGATDRALSRESHLAAEQVVERESTLGREEKHLDALFHEWFDRPGNASAAAPHGRAVSNATSTGRVASFIADLKAAPSYLAAAPGFLESLPKLFEKHFPHAAAASHVLLQQAAGVRDGEPEPQRMDIVVDQREEDQIRIQLMILMIQFLISLVVWVIVMTLCAYYHHSNKLPPGLDSHFDTQANHDSFKEWKFGLFACTEDANVTLCACFCPAIRWADNVHMAGVFAFWSAFAAYMVLLFFNAVLGGMLFLALLSGLCTHYRQRIREVFGMETGGMTYATDCLVYFCCTCCAIMQEGLHIEAAYRAGHPEMEKLRRQDQQPNVGNDPFLTDDLEMAADAGMMADDLIG